MSEKALWRYLRDGMKGRWHVQRHEDRLAKGIPDVSYALQGHCGWVELKFVPRWPRNRSDALRIPHLTIEQRLWLSKRGEHSDLVWVLLQVEKEYLLINHRHIDLVGHVNRESLVNIAALHCVGSLDFEELTRVYIGK